MSTLYVRYPGFVATAVAGNTSGTPAGAGFVGQIVESVVASATNVAGASGVFGDLTTIALTPGQWLLTGVVAFQQATANITQNSDQLVAVSAFSGNVTTDHQVGSNVIPCPQTASATSYHTGAVPGLNLNISTSATYYLKLNITYTAGTPTYQCRFSALRVR